jgi:hypothetical protein
LQSCLRYLLLKPPRASLGAILTARLIVFQKKEVLKQHMAFWSCQGEQQS